MMSSSISVRFRNKVEWGWWVGYGGPANLKGFEFTCNYLTTEGEK